MGMSDSEIAGGLAKLVDDRRLGARLEEGVHDRGVAVHACAHEWSLVANRAEVWIGRQGQKRAYTTKMATE